MAYIYSQDGTKKVDIDSATCLGDVYADLNIDRQGDNSQLWRSKNGSYFKGSCLHHVIGSNSDTSYCRFIPLTHAAAKAWIIKYYGADELPRFGFANDAEEI